MCQKELVEVVQGSDASRLHRFGGLTPGGDPKHIEDIIYYVDISHLVFLRMT